MRAVIDGKLEFEQQQLETASPQRQYSQRAVAGLDGVVSLDSGARTKRMVQKVMLRAQSAEALRQKISEIFALIDGMEHKLATFDGQSFERLRVDSVKTGQPEYSGSGVFCQLTIQYTQLGAL